MQYVHRQLGPGMPEYIYQEALCRKLVKEKFDARKEFIYHPFFDGEQLESYIKMDMVVIMPPWQCHHRVQVHQDYHEQRAVSDVWLSSRHIVSNSHSGELRYMAQSTDRALLLPRRYHQGFLK